MRLLSFSVSNYRSFFSEQTIKFDDGVKNVDAIFGPNGSGKSNLFMAIGFFRDFIRRSTQFDGQNMQYFSFMLNEKAIELPTTFKAEFRVKDHIYKYGFSLIMSNVVDETLSRKGLSSDDNYETLFSRKSLKKNRYEGYGFDSSLFKSTRENALILTKAWENNNKYALEIFEVLDRLKLISGDQPLGQTAQKVAEDSAFKTKLLDLLREADLYIQDVTATKVNLPDEVLNSLPLTSAFKKNINRVGFNVMTTHILRDDEGRVVGTREMPLPLESDGTRRIFELAFPLIDTLENGNILYVDELETHLHPRECEFITRLFTSSSNTTNAQLIVNTHNTQLMDQLGRNNVHLFGKNSREATIVGGIPKDIRTDDPALEKKYNKGMFGAVPNVGR